MDTRLYSYLFIHLCVHVFASIIFFFLIGDPYSVKKLMLVISAIRCEKNRTLCYWFFKEIYSLWKYIKKYACCLFIVFSSHRLSIVLYLLIEGVMFLLRFIIFLPFFLSDPYSLVKYICWWLKQKGCCERKLHSLFFSLRLHDIWKLLRLQKKTAFIYVFSG